MTAVTVALLPHEAPNAAAGWTPETGQALRTTLLPAEAAAREDSGLPPTAAPGPEERPAARADPREGLKLLDSAWDFLGGQSRHMAGPEVTGSPARGRVGTAGAGSPRDPGQL